MLFDNITSNPKFTFYFHNYLGTLDNKHVPAYISSNEYQLYQNQNRYLIKNVLAKYNFKIHFYYLFWE